MSEEVSEELLRALPISISKLTLVDVEKAIRQLDERIDNVKAQIYKTIHNHYEEFITAFQHSSDVASEIEALSNDLSSIRDSFESKDNGLQDELLASADTFVELKNQYSEYSHILIALQYLSRIHELFQSFDVHLDLGEYITVAGYVAELEYLLKFVQPGEVGSDIAIFTLLHEEYIRKRSLLEHRLLVLFGKTVTFIDKPNGFELVLSYRATGTLANKHHDNPIPLEHILHALTLVGIIDETLDKFSRDFVRCFLSPSICKCEGTLVVTPKKLTSLLAYSWPVDQQLFTSSNSFLPTVVPPHLAVQQVSGHVVHMMAFLKQYLFDYLKREYKSNYLSSYCISRILSSLVPQFEELFRRECLEPSLPRERKELDSYESTFGQHVRSMEAELNQILESSLQASARDSTEVDKHELKVVERDSNGVVEEQTTGSLPSQDSKFVSLDNLLAKHSTVPSLSFTKFLDRADFHFAEKTRAQILFTARQLLLDSNPNLVTLPATSIDSQILMGNDPSASSLVTVTTTSGQSVQIDTRQLASLLKERPRSVHAAEADFYYSYDTNYLIFPACVISERTQQFMALVRSLVHDSSQGKISPTLAAHYFFLIRDLMDLYRAVMPQQLSSDEGSSVSGIQASFVFFNDTMYVAHHLIYLGYALHTALPAPVRDISTFVDMLPLFRQRLAVPTFHEAVHRMKKELLAKLATRGTNVDATASRVKEIFVEVRNSLAMTKKILAIDLARKVLRVMIETGIAVFFEDLKLCQDWSHNHVLVFLHYADVFFDTAEAFMDARKNQATVGAKRHQAGLCELLGIKEVGCVASTFDHLMTFLDALNSNQYAALPSLCKNFTFMPSFDKADMRALLKSLHEIPLSYRDNCLKTLD